MDNNTNLKTVLQEELHWNRARIAFIVAFILALIKVTTVNLTKVANALGATAKRSSNYRRIQRFFALFVFDYSAWAKMVLKLLPIKGDFTISIDRTNWQFGTVPINILMAAIVYKGTAYPFVWLMLEKRGNSNTKERTELIEALLDLIPAALIKAIVADREFIGKQWFTTLDDYRLPYYIRIRENARVGYRGRTPSAKTLFSNLAVGQSRRLRKPRLIYGHQVFVAALRLETEYLIVVSNHSAKAAITVPRQQSQCQGSNHSAKAALETYRLRWGIEVLFAALKSRGFDFEQTHLVDPERIKKLVALLALAFTWAHLVGEWLAETKPLEIKKHGRAARSLFRSGLDHLQYVLLNPVHQRARFAPCVGLLISPLSSPPINPT